MHTDNSSFKNDLLDPVILSLAGFYLQKEKSEEEEEGIKNLTDKMQTLTKETRMQCLNWILGGGRQVSLETNNLS